MAAITSVIPLVLLVMVVWVAVACIRAFLLACRSANPDNGGPRCGACGYGLATGPNSSLRCPECGCSLLEAGITTAKTRARPVSATAGASAVALLLLLLASVAWVIALNRLGTVVIQDLIANGRYTPFRSSWFTGPDYTVDISFDGRTRDGAITSGDVTVTVEAATKATVKLDGVTGMVKDSKLTEVPVGGAFEQAEALALMRAAGIKPDNEADPYTILPESKSLASEVGVLLHNTPAFGTMASAGPESILRTSGSGSSSRGYTDLKFALGVLKGTVGFVQLLTLIAVPVWFVLVIWMGRCRARSA